VQERRGSSRAGQEEEIVGQTACVYQKEKGKRGKEKGKLGEQSALVFWAKNGPNYGNGNTRFQATWKEP
jgi:hypothetical protein